MRSRCRYVVVLESCKWHSLSSPPHCAQVPGAWLTGDYVPTLVRDWQAPVQSRDQVPDAVTVYRQVLSSAADNTVVIAAIGFATNIALLMRSGPDLISPLSGMQLLSQKVRLVVWQGGWYPARHPVEIQGPGGDFNWGCGGYWYNTSHCVGEASYAVVNMPEEVEQIFSEVGYSIGTGGAALQECSDTSNPCRESYITNMKAWGQDPAYGRASWDAVVTLAAVRGPANINGFKGGLGGRNVVRHDGGNSNWQAAAPGAKPSHQSYLVLEGDQPWQLMEHNSTQVGRAAHEALRAEIDRLLCLPPTSTLDQSS